MRGSTKLAFDQYRDNGIPPSDFIYSVLTNDLKETFARADADNLRDIREIVEYVQETMPHGAWGDPDKVAAWLLHRGIKGYPQSA
jgi:hypothetical protein